MRERGRKTYEQNAKWLKKIRLHNKLSFRGLAKETGVHFSTIHRIEHGNDASAVDYVTLMMWACHNNPVY